MHSHGKLCCLSCCTCRGGNSLWVLRRKINKKQKKKTLIVTQPLAWSLVYLSARPLLVWTETSTQGHETDPAGPICFQTRVSKDVPQTRLHSPFSAPMPPKSNGGRAPLADSCSDINMLFCTYRIMQSVQMKGITGISLHFGDKLQCSWMLVDPEHRLNRPICATFLFEVITKRKEKVSKSGSGSHLRRLTSASRTLMFYRFYVWMKQNGSSQDAFGLKQCEDICHCSNVVWYILTQVLEVVNHLASIIQK